MILSMFTVAKAIPVVLTVSHYELRLPVGPVLDL